MENTENQPLEKTENSVNVVINKKPRKKLELSDEERQRRRDSLASAREKLKQPKREEKQKEEQYLKQREQEIIKKASKKVAKLETKKQKQVIRSILEDNGDDDEEEDEDEVKHVNAVALGVAKKVVIKATLPSVKPKPVQRQITNHAQPKVALLQRQAVEQSSKPFFFNVCD